MIRLTNLQINSIYSDLSEYAKKICDNKYPCGEGGWIHFRVSRDEHMDDAYKLLNAKL